MLDKIKIIFSLIKWTIRPWFDIVKIIFTISFSIIRNPSFIMFSIVALGLGTTGIWIVFYPNGFDTCFPISQQLDNLSIFTFCIATLGNMATEYFFEEKGKDTSSSIDLEKIHTRHLAFFLWSIAAILSFYALKNDVFILPGLGSTLLLWLYVNFHRPKFQAINEAVYKNMNPNLSDVSEDSDSEIEGVGL
jgi:hypothetical protein